jgi:hypothetical protein
MADRDDYIQRLLGRTRLVEPQVIPDVILDALCWTEPSVKSWTWTVPDDGFIWHILSFTGTFYPTALIYGGFKVNGTYLYRYAGLYSWFLWFDRKRAPVVDADDVLIIDAINFSGSEKCLTWAMQFFREPA